MKVVPKELLTSVRIEGAEHITRELLFFWLLVGGNIGLLPKSPQIVLPYNQEGVRWSGPAHMALLHRCFMSLGLGVTFAGRKRSWDSHMQSSPDQWCSERICTNAEYPRVNKAQSSALLSATATGKPQCSSHYSQPNEQKTFKTFSTGLTLLAWRLKPELVTFAWGLWKTWSAAGAAADLLCAFPCPYPAPSHCSVPAWGAAGLHCCSGPGLPCLVEGNNFWCTTTGRVQNKHIKYLKFASKCTSH